MVILHQLSEGGRLALFIHEYCVNWNRQCVRQKCVRECCLPVLIVGTKCYTFDE